MIDEKLSYREHLESACKKASKTVSNLSRILANSIGPRTRKRRVLLEVVAVQRRGALRVACAYRTVSEAAVLVIAGAAPIDLLAFERAKLYDAKGNGDNSMEHGDTDFFLTQLLTGHGQFNAYLFKMGLHTTPTCKYCPNKIDNVEHTFFECARWIDYRSTTEEIIGTRLSPSSLVAYMIKKKKKTGQLLKLTHSAS
ncbi:uncharacterized protein LOC124355602 [Homalodisca vitripennis]|uniref:uncharacterized protein LOC124355602 n=1 Tax=Homalodisca vitripennis TaxID=197043 RepID=UPI001EEB9008|nr:uncharacterized protein LOC124355602 [Homalodisca vitripennis]